MHERTFVYVPFPKDAKKRAGPQQGKDKCNLTWFSLCPCVRLHMLGSILGRKKFQYKIHKIHFQAHMKDKVKNNYMVFIWSVGSHSQRAKYFSDVLAVLEL